ncbi:DUF4192 family protein [Pseudarthrobacter sp. AB1]|uniref:DUF4192 family protein n=1 Tax=Pseudarthrobacter sp. AB1 TaxID=2138309 RepID=UPI001D03BD97|nr:DUF4192 family protein [Pseudarthrobacter sp. AB1]
MVFITLADNHVGATLRVDLRKPDAEISYAKMVAEYLGHDTSAEGVILAVYTSEPMNGGHKPHAATIAALTGALAGRGLTIGEGLLVGDQTVSQYDGDPKKGVRLPLSATQSSQTNAAFRPVRSSDEIENNGRAGRRTIDGYRDTYRRVIKPALAGLRLHELSIGRIDRFLKNVAADHPATARHSKIVLTGMIGLAVRHDALHSNPVRDVGPIKIARKDVKAFSV